MTWSFETSLLAFLAMAAASQAIAIATRSRLSLPFVLGALCLAGLALGVLPRDFIAASRMRDVGFIAFNVLVVHSGTLLDARTLRAHKGAAAIGLAGVAALAVALGIGVAPLIGREAALYSIGPVAGGGAACAIASNSALRHAPGVAALPWLIFMAQGFFGLPLFAFAVRGEAKRMLADRGSVRGSGVGSATCSDEPAPASAGSGAARPATPLCERVPERFRTTAYYLAALMLAAVFNRWLYGAALGRLGVHPALSGLLLGALLARLGLLERDPLVKSGSMNFLMLGLMALMADSLAATPFRTVFGLAPVALTALAFGAAVLAAVGSAAGAALGYGWRRGLAVAAACMVSMPPASIVAAGIVRSAATDEGDRARVSAELLAPVEAASTLVTGVLSIAVSSAVGLLL